MEERGFQETIFHFDVVPFDLYWTSMKDKLDNKFYKTCGKYWQRKAAMKRHQNTHKKQIEVEVENGESKDDKEGDSEDDRKEEN